METMNANTNLVWKKWHELKSWQCHQAVNRFPHTIAGLWCEFEWGEEKGGNIIGRKDEDGDIEYYEPSTDK